MLALAYLHTNKAKEATIMCKGLDIENSMIGLEKNSTQPLLVAWWLLSESNLYPSQIPRGNDQQMDQSRLTHTRKTEWRIH